MSFKLTQFYLEIYPSIDNRQSEELKEKNIEPTTELTNINMYNKKR